MRFKQVGNKADSAFIVVKNNATPSIPVGAPVYFAMNGTDDGLAVQNANTSAGVNQIFFAGVLSAVQQGGAGNLSLATNFFGEAQVWGLCQTVRIVRQTRATSTDTFPTTSSLAVGVILVPSTVSALDAFTDSGTNFTYTGGVSSSGIINPMLFNYAILAQTLNSLTSQVSSALASTLLSNVVTCKAFLCAL